MKLYKFYIKVEDNPYHTMLSHTGIIHGMQLYAWTIDHSLYQKFIGTRNADIFSVKINEYEYDYFNEHVFPKLPDISQLITVLLPTVDDKGEFYKIKEEPVICTVWEYDVFDMLVLSQNPVQIYHNRCQYTPSIFIDKSKIAPLDLRFINEKYQNVFSMVGFSSYDSINCFHIDYIEEFIYRFRTTFF